MGAPLHWYLCRQGPKFGKLGYDWARVMLWCHGQGCKSPLTASYIHIRCIQSVLAPSYAVDGHMGAPLHWYLCRWGPNFGKLWYDWAQVMLWCHAWGCKPPLTASHIHIGCIKSVLAPSYALDGHMGAPLHCYTCAGGVGFLEKCGMTEPEWCCGVMVEAANYLQATCRPNGTASAAKCTSTTRGLL